MLAQFGQRTEPIQMLRSVNIDFFAYSTTQIDVPYSELTCTISMACVVSSLLRNRVTQVGMCVYARIGIISESHR
jgi:hypothetical protein